MALTTQNLAAKGMKLSITARSTLLSIILIHGLASQPRKYHPLYLTFALCIFSTILLTPFPEEDPATRYQAGIISVNLGACFDYLLLSNPQRTLRRNGDKEPASQKTYWQRLKWATTILANPRGANWNCAVSTLRYPTYTTRTQFVLTRLKHLVGFFLLADGVAFIARRVPALQYPPAESLSERGFAWQCLYVALFWMTLVGYMGIPHSLGSVITVALGISDLEDWPFYFGPLLATTKVRTFWGQTWHQSFRRSIQPQAKYLTRHLPHGLISRYTQLFLCFLLSGVYHAIGDWVTQRSLHSLVEIFKFFILQALAITFEDFVFHVGGKGMERVPRVVLWMWVVVWLGWSGPFWIKSMVESGVFESFAPGVKVSVFERVLGGFF